MSTFDTVHTNPEGGHSCAAVTFEEIECYVDYLLTGNIEWQPFNNKCMQDLTANKTLCRFYKASECINLSSFLALSNRRFLLRHYWKRDEKILKNELIKFFQTADLSAELIESGTEQPISRTRLDHIEPDSLHTSTNSIELLTEELLYGDSHIPQFDHLWIGDISDDVRLSNAYRDLEVSTISEFLALGNERMKIKNYGRRSERKLKEAIEAYLLEHRDGTPIFTQLSIEEHIINHDDLIAALRNKTYAKKAVSPQVWQYICKELKRSDLIKQNIAPIAAELRLTWPFSQKSNLSDKKIQDYLDFTIPELSDLDRFGRKKVRVYVACVIYLHKLLSTGGNPKPCSLKETIISLWKNSRLNDREEKVLHLRFGIQEERKHTLTEIKEYYGITRERVRQIEKIALAKLRMSRHFEDLPNLINREKDQIWAQLTQDSTLKKRDWMEPLEDQLGFEFQIAIELIDHRKNRNPGASALSYWLDSHFEHDESNWYHTSNKEITKNELPEAINPSLEAFLDTL